MFGKTAPRPQDREKKIEGRFRNRYICIKDTTVHVNIFYLTPKKIEIVISLTTSSSVKAAKQPCSFCFIAEKKNERKSYTDTWIPKRGYSTFDSLVSISIVIASKLLNKSCLLLTIYTSTFDVQLQSRSVQVLVLLYTSESLS